VDREGNLLRSGEEDRGRGSEEGHEEEEVKRKGRGERHEEAEESVRGSGRGSG